MKVVFDILIILLLGLTMASVLPDIRKEKL